MKIIEQAIKTKRKRYNKNKKKAWRKKIDISDIDKVLEDQRREERFGGPFADKEASELFCIDVGTEISQTTKTDLKKSDTTLKCHYLLDGLPGAKAVSQKGPTVRQREPQKLRSAKKVSGNTLKAVAMRNTMINQHRKSVRQNRNKRSKALKFSKDLWNREDKDLARYDEVTKSFMKEPLQHYKEQTKKNKVRVPSIRYEAPSVLPSITVPLAGTSYNPSIGDHQKLLSLAMREERRAKWKELKEKKLMKRLPKSSDGISPTQQLLEMTEGLPFFESSVIPPMDVIEEEDDNEEEKKKNYCSARIEKKSEQSKRKKVIERIKEQKRQERKQRRMTENQIYRVKSIVKEINEKDAKRKFSKKARSLKLKEKQKQTKRLAKQKFEDEDMLVPLGNEISDGVRSLEPRRCDLGSAMKNLQKRNIIETRDPKTKLTKKKTRKVVRRNVKQNMEKFVKNINL